MFNKNGQLIYFIVTFLSIIIGSTSAGLTLTVKCGEINCRLDQYCSQLTSQCMDCSIICNNRSQNYDLKRCEENCQNYLHTIRFVERGSKPLVTTTASSSEKNVFLVAVAALIVGCVALVISCILLAIFLTYLKRNNLLFSNIKKKKLANNKQVNNNDGSNNDNQKISYKCDNNLKLEMPPTANPVPAAPSSITGTHVPITPATVSTPLSSRPRHPVEDRTLEYAYDNPALTPSPVLEKDDQQQTLPSRMESSF